jgi:glutamate formiminotransferase
MFCLWYLYRELQWRNSRSARTLGKRIERSLHTGLFDEYAATRPERKNLAAVRAGSTRASGKTCRPWMETWFWAAFFFPAPEL